MKNKKIITGLIIAAVVVVVGGLAFYFNSRNLQGSLSKVGEISKIATIQNRPVTTGTPTAIKNSFAIDIAAYPGSASFESGTMNAELLGLNVRSIGSLDLSLKNLTVQGYVDSNTTGLFSSTGAADFAVFGDNASSTLKDIADTFALYDGDLRVSDLKNASTDGKIVFNNLNMAVVKNTTRKLTLRGHINNAAPFGSANDRIKFGINAATGVTVLNSSGLALPGSSINVAGAANYGTTDMGTIMTITKNTTGTPGTSGTTSPTGAAPTPTFSDLKVDKDPYDPNSGEITFSYTVNNLAIIRTVQIGVYQASDLTVLPPIAEPIITLPWPYATINSSGTYTQKWDGKDANQNILPPGSYAFRVVDIDASGTGLPPRIIEAAPKTFAIL